LLHWIFPPVSELVPRRFPGLSFITLRISTCFWIGSQTMSGPLFRYVKSFLPLPEGLNSNRNRKLLVIEIVTEVTPQLYCPSGDHIQHGVFSK
jgi:hypothetical protein